jgi:plasmid stability protein
MAQINIRGIDDAIYRKLKSLAALAGKGVYQYVIDLLTKHVGGNK